ncbi:MAG: flagellar brake protein [Sulfurimicrobium sp.]|jgi:c-di-GMP-binding flagellar brake protein YcgR|nr:flagellar brake protein [Sulfurimicrobium sp.]
MANQPPLKTEAAPETSNYMIHSRMEIIYILRAIQHKNELVTAYFNQGTDFILTSIIDVDSDNGTVVFDYGANVLLNKRILESEKIILVTTQDKVKVQFVIGRMQEIEYLGRPAFRSALPDGLLKLQRREYYRLSTPLINPIKCSIPQADSVKIEVPIADISLGGIAITQYQEHMQLEIGARFKACRILLPDIGTVITDIEIRNEQEITMKNGAKNHRAGCMFIDLHSSQQAMIQRYIIKLDRERRSILPE